MTSRRRAAVAPSSLLLYSAELCPSATRPPRSDDATTGAINAFTVGTFY